MTKSKDRRDDEAVRNAQRRNRDHGDLNPSESRPSTQSAEGEPSADRHRPDRRDDEPSH